MTIEFKKTSSEGSETKPVYRILSSSMLKTNWEDALNQFHADGYDLVATLSPSSETEVDPGHNALLIFKLRGA